MNSPGSQPGFKDGVIDFQGKGTRTSDSNSVRISHGESVINAFSTAKYKPLLTAIQKDDFGTMRMVNNDGFKADNSGISKTDISVLAKKMDENTEAILLSKTEVHTDVNEHGVKQMVVRRMRADRRRWG